MTEEQARVPKLRFPGFTDAWEQRKLGDVAEKVTEKNSDRTYTETLTNSAEFGIVNQRDFFEKDISNMNNIVGYYLVRDGDFVYNPRISASAPVGPINRNRLGRTGIMSPLYYVFRAHDIDPLYLEKFFTTTNWHSFMKLNGDSGARSDRLSIKDSVFRKMPVPFPSLSEQYQIGTFFSSLDNLIKLHQRKLSHLTLLKKGLLQKMFPKQGEAYPEIRFPGFTDAWEQRKLSDIADIVGGGTPDTGNVDFWDGDINWFVPAEIGESVFVSKSLRRITDSGLRNSSAKMLPVGTVLFTSRAGIGKTAILSNPAATNQGFQSIVPHEKQADSYFIFARASELKRYGEKVGAGSTFVEVSGKQMTKMPISIPSVFEQRQIGAFFASLDTLITLHQRKLSHLQQQKKTLLQQMFV